MPPLPSYRLIKAFEDRTTLPINLNEVRQWLLDNRIQDEIKFVPVEIDVGAVRGFVKRFRRPRSGWDIEPQDVSHIYYGVNQPAEWRNMVCAKELLHIQDAACVATKEQFHKLTQRLALPADVRHLGEEPDFVAVDKNGTAPASALLFPMAVRDLVMPDYSAGRISAEDIARQAVMPVEHVRTVLSDFWPVIHALMAGDDEKFGRAASRLKQSLAGGR